ncbi:MULTISPECIES: DUF4231 domain-containing protein [Fructobacillus]|jgi:hypothetical protein|uniref:DUF4231 domain-containing protein n=2 Tax=Fructobacillus TaxID=559173 RepID=A0ABM9MVI0_9LACO|nr:hypothetical protein LMG30237_ALEAABJJ_00290 [Fructobacillus tropaeoli]CAK1231899.1 hypothetical protein R55250_KEHBDPNM_00803 [Fructobacillus sp. LMG 32999]CAK1249417.1 hypothetical protein R82265_HNDDMDAM_01178 [Fructobacillus cardui]CAK1235111.1 hypothetical protein R53718_MFFEMHAI_00903 [Fructobacillus sp. LMG 32999]CAK1235499.1 hypothetical protein R55214_HHFBAMCI_00562 [Fructobacillus sp. LMG 32999]
MITRLELRDNLSTAIKKLESQYKYYKKISSILSMLNITLSSSIPIIISLSEKNVHLLIIVSVFSAIITLIQTTKSTFKIEDKKNLMGTALITIKKEQLLFDIHASPYDQTDDEDVKTLVKNIINSSEQSLDDFFDSVK